MAAERFKYLFTPFQIGSMKVKNRLVFLPHLTGFVMPGVPGDRQNHYLTERARGGVGLIIEGGQGASIISEHTVPAFRRLSDAVHGYGAKIIAQLHHPGAEQPAFNRQPLLAPSDVPDPFGMNEIPKSMEKEDIQRVISSFAKAAIYSKEGGYDGVELKAGHDGLLREFWSPASNLRQDEYGGSLDNRMRLILEILKAIKDAVGRDFVVGVRPCLDEFKPGGYNLEEGLEISKKLAASGLIDYLSADVATLGTGVHLTDPPMDMPLGCNVWASAALKEAVELPVIASARINDPMLAEKILADGQADLIGMARQLLCDPETPNKALEGRLDDIRHCMACQWCFYCLITIGYIRCAQNPAASNEKELGVGTLKTVEREKKVVVVGGGPGGMKVAEIAARRGHEVILYESDAELGGQVKLAEKGPSRADIGEVTHWLGVQIKKLGVKVRTGVAATAEVVEAEKPDVVVIATGARPVRPGNIAGSEQGNVFTPWEVMAGTAEVGQKVIVYSSWRAQAAASAAEFLANQGKEIEIVTPTPFFGMELPPGAMIPPYLRLLEKGVKFTPFLAIVQIQGDRITLINVISQQPEERAGIDSVVLSTPAKANDELYFALKGRVREIYRVGDCVAPRHIDAAVYDGEMVGRTL